jgi:hypothetical protein
VKNERKKKVQICILDENEKFEERKCAYFLRKLRGKGNFKHFFHFFSHTPSGGR